MKHSILILAAAISTLAASAVQAGQLISVAPADGKKTTCPVEEKRSWFPDDPMSPLTLGGLWSKHLSGGYLDNITGIYATQSRETFYFLDTMVRYEDNGQFQNSTGFAVRHRLPGRDVIFGLNAFYDAINSAYDNDFDSFGFGAEILTRWVDARLNYYLPEDKQFEIGRYSRSSSSRSFGPTGTLIAETERRRSFKIFEAPLEGVDAEIGVLIPGLDKVAEVRIFGGYFHYVNPYGGDYEGFKARLEARILPGLIADVAYYSDSYILGGHWAAGVRASLPFSIGNLVQLKNPFEGAAEMWRPRQRDFSERMSDMIIRSPRLLTTTGSRETSHRTTSRSIANPGIAPVPFE